MGEAGQRVGLVHELAELGGSEELLDGGRDRTDVDQALGRDRIRVLGGHALFDDPLEPGQADPHLVLDQFADRADPAVAEVVDVVGVDLDLDPAMGDHRLLAGVERHQVLDGVDDVLVAQHLGVGVGLVVELLGDLVAADLGQVVALGVAEQGLDEASGRLHRGRLTRSQLAIQVDQRLVLVVGGVALDGVADRLGAVEQVEDLLIGLGDGKGAEEGGDVLAALAIDPDADRVALVGVELEPGSPAGDDAARVDHAVGSLVGGLVEVDARGTDQLGDDDALGAVDDEDAVLGHHREVAEEDLLLLDLAGAPVHEPGGDEERARRSSDPAPCTRRG